LKQLHKNTIYTVVVEAVAVATAAVQIVKGLLVSRIYRTSFHSFTAYKKWQTFCTEQT